MLRLKYDPASLCLQLIDASDLRRVSMPSDLIGRIVRDAREVHSLKSIRMAGNLADPCELVDLIPRIYQIADADFDQRILRTTGRGLLRQELEELFSLITCLELVLPAEPTTDHIRLVEKCVGIKRAWSKTTQIVVELPTLPGPRDLHSRLSQLELDSQVQIVYPLRRKDRLHPSETELCEAPFREITVNVWGNLVGCGRLSAAQFGSVISRSVKEAWESSEIEYWRFNRTSQCHGCPGVGQACQKSLRPLLEQLGAEQFHQLPLDKLAQLSDVKKSSNQRKEIFLPTRKAS